VPELAGPARAARKVGLGVMGLAELLAVLGIPYDSVVAVRLADRVFRVIAAEARRASAALAAQRGPFPLYEQSTYARNGIGPLRNAQLTSVAPTGTVSLIAGTTSRIEPMFALAYTRHILGRQLPEANPLLERLARDRGFYSEDLMAEIARTGTVRQIPCVPADVRASFVTALGLRCARLRILTIETRGDAYPVTAGRTGGGRRCLPAGQGAFPPGRRRRGWRRPVPRSDRGRPAIRWPRAGSHRQSC